MTDKGMTRMFYISNLAVGLEQGLDDPAFLLKSVGPFEGRAGVELFLHYHDEAYRHRAERALEWLGPIARTVHGPFLHVEGTSEKNSVGQAYLFEAYRWAFQTAEHLGCREMVFHTHQRIVEEREKRRAQQNVRENLDALIDMGREHGVMLLIENLGIQKSGVSLFDEEDFLELVRDFPQTGCLIDTGHLNVAGWNTRRVIKELAGRIRAYHLHNNDGRTDSHRPIGEGSFDFPAFYQLYRRFTPNASLTLEYGDGERITPELLARDLQSVIAGVLES